MVGVTKTCVGIVKVSVGIVVPVAAVAVRLSSDNEVSIMPDGVHTIMAEIKIFPRASREFSSTE